jgi:hypothetical protein
MNSNINNGKLTNVTLKVLIVKHLFKKLCFVKAIEHGKYNDYVDDAGSNNNNG